jgi:hypothetical protein
MPPDPDPLRAETEPRGFLPRRAGAARSRWQRLKRLLGGGRDDLEQEGLLVERDLLLRPRAVEADRDLEPRTGERLSTGSAEPH